MTFSLFLICMLGAVGLSHLVVDGSIFAKWREFFRQRYSESRPWIVELITCYQCTGFWSGALLGLVLQPVSWNLFQHLHFLIAASLSISLYLFVTPVIMGCAASYLSMAAAAFLNWLDAPAIAAASAKKE